MSKQTCNCGGIFDDGRIDHASDCPALTYEIRWKDYFKATHGMK